MTSPEDLKHQLAYYLEPPDRDPSFSRVSVRMPREIRVEAVEFVQSSPLPIKEACTQIGIEVHQFSNWRSTIRNTSRYCGHLPTSRKAPTPVEDTETRLRRDTSQKVTQTQEWTHERRQKLIEGIRSTSYSTIIDTPELMAELFEYQKALNGR